MALQLGEGHIDGQLTLDSSSSIPKIHADLTLAKLNFDKLLHAKGKQTKPEAKKAGKPRTDRVFSDQPLPFEKLLLANINIRLHLKDIVRNKKRLKEALIKANLTEGKLTATILKHSLVQGEFVADLVVDASNKETTDITIRLNVPQIELSEIVIADSGAAAVKGPLTIDIKLHSRGNSVAQIMGSLNGNIKLLMEQGSADAKALDMFVGGLSAMAGTIFTDKSSKTTINCAISDLIVVDGILTPQLAVLDTQFSTVFADGQADLKNEQLNIEVTPVAKGVTLSVAFPVHLQGTFGNPQIQIEKTDALLKSGEIWATVAYPPALLLKFTDLDDGKQNPCVTMVAEKAGIPIIEDIGKAVSGTVKGVGSGIGKLLDSTKKRLDSIAPTESATEAVAEDEDEEDDFDMD